jgi:hypothetical protein
VLDDDRHVGLDHGRIRGIAGTGSGSVRSVEAKVLRTPCRQTDSIGSYRFAFLDIESDQNFGIAIGRVQQTGILVRQQRRQTISVDIDTPELSIWRPACCLGDRGDDRGSARCIRIRYPVGAPDLLLRRRDRAARVLAFRMPSARHDAGNFLGRVSAGSGLFVLRTLDLGFRNVIALVKGAVQDVV